MALREVVAGAAAALGLGGFVLLPAAPPEPTALASEATSLARSAPASLSGLEAVAHRATAPRSWSAEPSELAVAPVNTGEQAVALTTPALAARSTARGPVELILAYRRAADAMPAACHLSPALLAAIGQVESGNLGGRTVVDHVAVPGVFGPPLTGGPFANIPDTDGGRYDGSSAFDRAVGPLQFIPSTWAVAGKDGDGDGVADPQNVHDAALAAAGYLCAGGRDLDTPDGLAAALWSYNRSTAYADLVRAWFARFSASGLAALADVSVPVSSAGHTGSALASRPLPTWPVQRPTPRPRPTSTASAGAAPVTGAALASSTSPSPTASVSQTTVPSVSAAASASASASATPSPTGTPTSSASASPTASVTASATGSPVASASASATASPSSSPSASPAPCASPDPSGTSPSPSVDGCTSPSTTADVTAVSTPQQTVSP